MGLTPEQREVLTYIGGERQVTASEITPGSVLIAVNGENTYLMEPDGEYTPIENVRRPVE